MLSFVILQRCIDTYKRIVKTTRYMRPVLHQTSPVDIFLFGGNSVLGIGERSATALIIVDSWQSLGPRHVHAGGDVSLPRILG